MNHSTSTWSPASKVENSPFPASRVSLAANSSGAITTIWVQPDATLFHVYASRTTIATGQTRPLGAGQGSQVLATPRASEDTTTVALSLPRSTDVFVLAAPAMANQEKSASRDRVLADFAWEPLDDALIGALAEEL